MNIEGDIVNLINQMKALNGHLAVMETWLPWIVGALGAIAIAIFTRSK